MVSFKWYHNSLRLVVSGEEKFIFRRGMKLCEAGFGANSYKMSHGSFKISEKVDERESVLITDIVFGEKSATLYLTKGKMELSIDNDIVKFTPLGFDGCTRMWFSIPARVNEYIYGTGEVFSEFNLRGKKTNVWVAEHINASQIAKKLAKQIVGVKNSTKKQKFSKYETYYAQPTFISSQKYFFHSDTTALAVYDFRNTMNHEIRFDEIAPFYFGFGESFEDVISKLTTLVGRQPELPDWVYDGYILGIQGGTDVLMSKVKTAIDNCVKVAGAWIQDWEGRRVTAVGKQLFWNWEYDNDLYPNLPNTISELNAMGVKVLGYVNPFLAVEKPLYKEASEKGYCVKNADGEDYYVTITTFPAAMIDLTNPDACEWLKGVIKKNMIDIGLSGWMADFGEYLPTDAVLFSGENAELVHNTWPVRWAKLNREVVEEAGKLGEIMFFTRAGYTNSQRYSTMMWNGDNHTDFSYDFGLPSVIPAMLSLTCCGFGLSHSDIGGYTSFFNLKRSAELYQRWCEMNAFSPIMRGHEGLNPDLNAQCITDDVLGIEKKMSTYHKALKPYIKDAVEYNAKTGVGVVRPLFFYYDEEQAYTECYEYLLGRDILVAPVIRPNKKDNAIPKREVYLPNDEWVYLWNGREYAGGNHIIDAPIGEPPVFIRKSAQNVLDIVNNLRNNQHEMCE